MQRRKFLKTSLATIAVSSLASNLMAKNLLKTSEKSSFTNSSVAIDGKKYKLSLKFDSADISEFIPNNEKKVYLQIWSEGSSSLEFIECAYNIKSVTKTTEYGQIYNVDAIFTSAYETQDGASTYKSTSISNIPTPLQKAIQFMLNMSSYDEYLLTLKISPSESVSLYDDNSFYGEDCFLTSACTHSKQLPDDCYELQTLRNFRDSYMKSSTQGNELVANYYNIAPPIVRKINRLENKNEVYDYIYQTLVLPSLQYIEENKKEKAMEYYKEYTEALNKLFN